MAVKLNASDSGRMTVQVGVGHVGGAAWGGHVGWGTWDGARLGATSGMKV